MKYLLTLLLLAVLLIAPRAAARQADPYERAEALVDEGKDTEAAEMFAVFLENFPYDDRVPAALMGLAWSRIHLGQHEAALATLDELGELGEAERIPDLMQYTRGLCFEHLGRTSDALGEYQRLVAAFPSSALAPGAEARVAICLYKTGRLAEALPALNKAIEVSGEPQTELRSARYRILMENRGYEEAYEDVRILARSLPKEDAEPYFFEMAELEERLNRPNMATLMVYLLRYPEGPSAAAAHRLLSMQMADTDARIAHLRKAVDLGDMEPFATENKVMIARLSESAGDTLTAVAFWRELIGGSEGVLAFERLDRLVPGPDSQLLAFAAATVRSHREAFEARRMMDAVLNRLRGSDEHYIDVIGVAWDAAAQADADPEDRIRWAEKLKDFGAPGLAKRALSDLKPPDPDNPRFDRNRRSVAAMASPGEALPLTPVRYMIVPPSARKNSGREWLGMLRLASRVLGRFWPEWMPATSRSARHYNFDGHRAVDVVFLLEVEETSVPDERRCVVIGRVTGSAGLAPFQRVIGTSGNPGEFESELERFVEEIEGSKAGGGSVQ